MPAQRPKQAIYEVIKYCGMKAVRGHSTQQPRADQKALEQDDYMFESAIIKALEQDDYMFESAIIDRKKHRARGW
jgi:hypothetical protein